jgi:hypothetical protein
MTRCILILGVVLVGCKALKSGTTMPVAYVSSTVELARPTAGKPIEGGKLTIWSFGQVVRPKDNVVDFLSRRASSSAPIRSR